MPTHLEILSRHQMNSKSSKRLKDSKKDSKTQKDSKYNSRSDCN